MGEKTTNPATTSRAGIEPQRCTGDPIGAPSAIAWTADDRRILAATTGGQIVVYDARTGERRQELAVGEPVMGLRAVVDGVRIELRDRRWLRLDWTMTHDGMIEETLLSSASDTSDAIDASDRGSRMVSNARDRTLVVNGGRIEIWPVEDTEAWVLGRLRALVVPDRPRLTARELDELRAEVLRCDEEGRPANGVEVCARLLLSDPRMRGMNHVARALFCQALGDQRGEYFELWDAERCRRAGDPELASEPNVVERYGIATALLEPCFATGVLDADDWRLLNVASRAYDAGFAAMRRGDAREALVWLVDALSIRPQAVTWFYAGRLLALREEYELACWCLDHIEGCADSEQRFLFDGLDPEVLGKLRATCRELAASSWS